MLPELLASERREGQSSVPHEAPNCVGVQSEEKGNKQVVGVPERLEGLLANPVMGGRVHQEHAKEHDMASDTTWLGVVDLDGCHWPDLCLLDVEEAKRRLA